MSMTLDNFGDYLDRVEQRIVNLTPILTEVGNQVTAELQNSARTHNWKKSEGLLANSIRVEVRPTEFGVFMNNYGAFQNYGVKSFEGKGKNTDQENPGAFNNNRKFEFGTGNYNKGGRPWGAYYSGLNAQNWFSMEDLTQDVTDYLGQAITEELQRI